MQYAIRIARIFYCIYEKIYLKTSYNKILEPFMLLSVIITSNL